LCAVLELARLGRWLQPPAELEGRSMALTLTDLGLRHGLCCRHGRFRPHPVADAELSLSASLADVLQLLAGQVDADTLFFQRRLAIAGDTELGLVVKNWLDAQERPAWLTQLAARWNPM
jgi:predicted lipid carrier protein YhbT